MGKNKSNENIDFDKLEQHKYHEPGLEDAIFYTCPICGKEYLDTFMTKENGEVMCIDCWAERYGDNSNNIPEGCLACGGPYPECKDSCNLFDN